MLSLASFHNAVAQWHAYQFERSLVSTLTARRGLYIFPADHRTAVNSVDIVLCNPWDIILPFGN